VTFLSRAFALIDSRLDKSAVGRRWQRDKWRIAYRFGVVHPTPSFEELIDQPRRSVLTRTVAEFGGVGSVLEVGCGQGQNLYLLSRALRGATLYGIDISATAVVAARRELAARGLSTVNLDVADIVDLRAFRDASVDVVVADAVLLYLPPTQIETALREILRVAARGVVLSTWDLASSQGSEPWVYDEGTWVYDHRRLLEHRNDLRIEAVSVPRDMWPDGRWTKYGVVLKLTRRPEGPSAAREQTPPTHR
jgi:SAM-dependent methyltransferase